MTAAVSSDCQQWKRNSKHLNWIDWTMSTSPQLCSVPRSFVSLFLSVALSLPLSTPNAKNVKETTRLRIANENARLATHHSSNRLPNLGFHSCDAQKLNCWPLVELVFPCALFIFDCSFEYLFFLQFISFFLFFYFFLESNNSALIYCEPVFFLLFLLFFRLHVANFDCTPHSIWKVMIFDSFSFG